MFISHSSYVHRPMNIGSFFGVLSAEKMENAAFFHQTLADSWNCCTFAGGFAPIRRRLNITFGRVGQKQYKPGLVHRSKNTPARKIRKTHQNPSFKNFLNDRCVMPFSSRCVKRGVALMTYFGWLSWIFSNGPNSRSRVDCSEMM